MLIAACGSNGSGQLALSHTDDVSVFTPVEFDPLIPHEELQQGQAASGGDIKIVSAAHHSLLLVRAPVAMDVFESRLYGVGTNSFGQLGRKCALRDEDAPPQSWTRFRRVSLFPSGSGMTEADWEVVHIAATWTTSFAVYRRKSNPAGSASSVTDEQPIDVVVAAGSNDFGELGQAHTVDARGRGDGSEQGPVIVDVGLRPGERIEKLRCGQRHAICLITDPHGVQRLVGWGASRKGELDPSRIPSTLVPTILISNSNPTAEREGAQSGGIGSGKGKGKAAPYPRVSTPHALPYPVPPPTIDMQHRITDLALGASHSVALLSTGRIVAWGSDAKGQLSGLNEMTGAQQIAASWNSTFVLDKHGVWSQGSNTHGQLVRSICDRESSQHSPTTSPGSLVPSAFPSSTSDTPVLPQRSLIQYPLTCETYTSAANISQSADVTSLDGREVVEKIRCGTEHLLIWTKSGKLLVGGWNEHGNLGLGDLANRSTLHEVQLGSIFERRKEAGWSDSWEALGPAEREGEKKRRLGGIWGGCGASWIVMF